MATITFVDRYSATGTPYPDDSSCDDCDGMGLYPCQVENIDEEALKTKDGTLTIIGQRDDNGAMSFDGWLIVRCPTCKGTKKKPIAGEK